MIIVSKEEGAKWPNLGSLTELRGFYGTIYEHTQMYTHMVYSR